MNSKIGSPAKKEEYVTQRKKIWKGKIAPTGTFFLVVRVNFGKGKATSMQHLPGGLKDEVVDLLAKEMYSGLKEKYST